MKSVKAESRPERRFVSSRVAVTLLGLELPALDWSPTGFLVDDRLTHIAPGTVVKGLLTSKASPGIYRFSAVLLRRDDAARTLAFAFVEPSQALNLALARSQGG